MVYVAVSKTELLRHITKQISVPSSLHAFSKLASSLGAVVYLSYAWAEAGTNLDRASVNLTQ